MPPGSAPANPGRPVPVLKDPGADLPRLGQGKAAAITPQTASDSPAAAVRLAAAPDPASRALPWRAPAGAFGRTATDAARAELERLRAALERAEEALVRERRAGEWRCAMLRAELLDAQAKLDQAGRPPLPIADPIAPPAALAVAEAELPARSLLAEAPIPAPDHRLELAEALLASRSWRYTKPLRAVARLLRGTWIADRGAPPAGQAKDIQGWIDTLQRSRSWRCTAPLRRVRTLLVPGAAAHPLSPPPVPEPAPAGAVPELPPPAPSPLQPSPLQPSSPQPSSPQPSPPEMPAAPLHGILVVADTLPLFDRSSGGLRLQTLIELLAANGAAVTFGCLADRALHDDHLLPGGGRHRYEAALTAGGVGRLLYGITEIRAALAAPGGALETAFVAFPEVARQLISAVRAQAPGARILYDMVDFHALRLERQAALHDDPAQQAEAQRIRRIELANIEAADLTLAITEDERRAVLAALPQARVAVLPNVFRLPPGEMPGPRGRAGLLFVGGFWHAPNGDAVLWFAREVWPLVRAAVPEARLCIAGNAPTEAVLALAGRDGIEVPGYVEDLGPLYARSRLAVAPLRFGAGMKGKVGQSMAQGLPVVATTIGAEGMDLRDGVDLLVADTAPGFAAAVLRVLGDDALWSRLQANGRAAIARQASVEVVDRRLRAFVDG